MMTDNTLPDTPVRKAFHAFTQYRTTIARIILDTPELARAYLALLFLTRFTIATCIVVSGYAFLTTDSLLIPVTGLGIFLILVSISPSKSILIGGVVGTILLGIQLHPEALTVDISTYIGMLGVGTMLTAIVAAYLTKHAVSIASQIWEYEMNPETPTGTPDETETNS